MIKVTGKVNEAICFAKIFEDKAKEQIETLCNQSFVSNSKIRIMPDVHAGKGCTIGTTMTIADKVVPNLVGVDIGCGMYVMNIGKEEIDLKKLDKICYEVPSGKNIWDSKKETFDISRLHCYPYLRTERVEKSIGTLGGGNHFIEVDRGSDGTQYLIIHTGSRNLGKQVAEYYQKVAIEQCELKLQQRQRQKIEELRNSGREKEIQNELKKVKQDNSFIEELAYLEGEKFNSYMHDIEICQNFAKLNRETIAKYIAEKMGFQTFEKWHTIHNYIDIENMILRKGAISAKKGEKVLIPLNMRDGSIIAVGKGNPEWNYSAPHGAGRLKSRTEAKKEITIDEYIKSMNGIYTSSVNMDTLDESPMSYKPKESILDVISETVEVLEVVKPIYNFKATE